MAATSSPTLANTGSWKPETEATRAVGDKERLRHLGKLTPLEGPSPDPRIPRNPPSSRSLQGRFNRGRACQTWRLNLTLTVTILGCWAFRMVLISLSDVIGKPSFSFSIFNRFRATISSGKKIM